MLTLCLTKWTTNSGKGHLSDQDDANWEFVHLWQRRCIATATATMKRSHRIVGGAAILLLGLGAVIGLNRSKSAADPMTPPPPDVIVATVERRDLPVEREWVGTLDGMVNASIKAQVSGYLLRQDYNEGSFVRKGQLLFEIDSRSPTEPGGSRI